MSIKIDIDSLSSDVRKVIATKLQFQTAVNKYQKYAPRRWIYPYEIVDNDIYLPFSYAQTKLKLSRPSRDIFPQTKLKFIGELREVQLGIRKETFDNLNKSGCCLISLYTGGGKTAYSIYVVTKINMKAIIIVHRLVLIDQWEKSIKKFCPKAKIQILDSSSKIEDVDFYIINAINVPKFKVTDFSNISIVILDEAHLIVAETLSQCLKFFTPRYLLGLSATPYRVDGLDVLFDLYFGKNRIHRDLNHKHIVYKVNTNFTPETEMTRDGKLDWNSVLKSQCENEERNELIIDIVKKFSKRNILILCKRVNQARHILKRLKEEKEEVTSLIGKEREFDEEARIVVGTTSKVGVGFDHPKLDTLLLASDVEQYYIQILGRIFRSKDIEPMVFDLVDEMGILKKHWNTRRKVYIKHGGEIKLFDKEFGKKLLKSKNDIKK